MKLLTFIIIMFISWFICLMILTILANIFKWNDHQKTELRPDCHPIMVPLSNGYYYEYLCDKEDK